MAVNQQNCVSGESRYSNSEVNRDADLVFSQWEEPIPFAVVKTPDFPVNCLPGPVSAFVRALALNTQTPPEMAGLLSLGILATAFQKRYSVEVTADWKEPLCLYTVAVALPGERKSAVISSITEPVYEFEDARQKLEAGKIARNQAERDILEKRLEAAKRAALKGKGDVAVRQAEALELAERLEEFENCYPLRLLVDDTTPEKLVDLMTTQEGAITVASAEGGVFDAMQGRYDGKGGLDIYLKAHAGDPIVVDRIGRKGNQIRRPRLTMLLTVQPEVLRGLMKNSAFRGRGLCGRFLYAICESKIGSRESNPPSIPVEVKSEYQSFVRRILADDRSGIIRLSPEASTVRADYQTMIEKRLGDKWEPIRDWGGKLTGAMVRIAALLHAAEQESPAEIPITAETMERATEIAEFLGVHAEAAYQIMGADEERANAKYLWGRLQSTGLEKISKRDLFEKCKGKFHSVEAMTPAVNTLEDMRYVRVSTEDTGGRPTTMIYANPRAQYSQ